MATIGEILTSIRATQDRIDEADARFTQADADLEVALATLQMIQSGSGSAEFANVTSTWGMTSDPGALGVAIARLHDSRLKNKANSRSMQVAREHIAEFQRRLMS